MSKRFSALIQNVLWLAGLAVLAVVMVLMLRNSDPAQPDQEPEPKRGVQFTEVLA